MASNITSSVIQPIFGYLSDQKEKRFLLPMGCLFAGLGLSFIAVPDSYWVVMMLVTSQWPWDSLLPPGGIQNGQFLHRKQDGDWNGGVYNRWEYRFGPRSLGSNIHNLSIRTGSSPLNDGISNRFPFESYFHLGFNRTVSTNPCIEKNCFERYPQGNLSFCRVDNCRSHNAILDTFWSNGLHSFLLYRLRKGRPLYAWDSVSQYFSSVGQLVRS